MMRNILWILPILLLLGLHCHAKPRHRPRNVTATVTDITGLRLHWLPPRLPRPDCPVKRYLIRLKHDGQKRSKTWKVDGNRLSLSLHDLQQDSWYSLRIVAVTCDGKGAPTRWIKVRTGNLENPGGATPSQPAQEQENRVFMGDADPGGSEEAAPGKPTYVRTRTYSDSVTLSWRPPEERMIRLRGYMVGYGEGVPDVHWQYVDASTSNVTIRNLKSATQYLISLRAFNNYGKGPVIYDLIFTRNTNTPTVGPFSPPTNLKAKVLSPSTAWLQWTDPSLGRPQQITDNRYYNVHYQPLPTGKTLSVIVKDQHVVLYDLIPGTNYLFKVRTVRNSQSSPFSLAIQNRTFETVPTSSPRSVKAVPGNDSTTSLVSWRPPRQPNGEITAYMVMYTTQPKMPITKWHVRIIMGMSAHALLTGLYPNTTYYIKVQAQNSQGYGPTSSTVSFTTPDATYRSEATTPPTSMWDAFGHAADDDDDDDDDDEDEEDVYDDYGDEGLQIEHDYHDEEENHVAGEKLERIVDGQEDVLGFGGRDEVVVMNATATAPLQPAAQVGEPWGPGGGSLGMENSGGSRAEGRGERSLEVKFQSVVKHTVSAVVTWKEPCDLQDQLTRYQIRYHALDDPDLPLDKYTPTSFVILDNLRPNARYVYKLRRLGTGGEESAWSDIGLLDTTVPDSG